MGSRAWYKICCSFYFIKVETGKQDKILPQHCLAYFMSVIYLLKGQDEIAMTIGFKYPAFCVYHHENSINWKSNEPYKSCCMIVKHFLDFLLSHSSLIAIAHFSCRQPQALSLLLALILRATVSSRRADFDYEDGYDVRGRSWEPLLNPQPGQPSGSSKGDNSGNHSDFWSSRMRQKVCSCWSWSLNCNFFDNL